MLRMLPMLVVCYAYVNPVHSIRAAEPPIVRQIVAHRGSSADRPECTLSSVRRAIEAGATATEVDVRTTKDGKLVILHDATLDRTTNGTGPLNEKTWDEIRHLDAGTWFDPQFKDERIPTLADVLRACRGKIDVLLDLKQQGTGFARTVAELVAQAGHPERVIVGVRSVEQAKLFRRLLPTSRQLGLIASPREIEDYAGAGVETIRLWPRWLKDPAVVGRVRAAGAMLHLNGTTGTPEDIAPLLKHHPDSLSSDDPARLVRSLGRLQLK